jgi:nucleoside-diphosphate-sugar epimerase
MRILVTGCSGFIGSHIVDVLIKQGHSVANLDIKPVHRQDVFWIQL